MFRPSNGFAGSFLIVLTGAASLIFGLTACGSDRPEVPDTSHIDLNLEIRRFDQAFFNLDTTRLDSALSELENEYPEFSNVFFNYMLPIRRGDLDTLQQLEVLNGFVNYPPVRDLYQTVQQEYGNLAPVRDELEPALRLYSYYFPDQPMPRTLTAFIGEYQYAALVYGENDLAVGLDLFLGEDYPYHQLDPQNPLFSRYLTRTYNRDHLVSKVVQTLVEDVVGQPPGGRMIDFMVHNGKKLYILDQLLPYTLDSIKMEVSGEQIEWLEENELNIWSFFVSEELLYSTSFQDFRKYIEPSPNSPGMPPEAPGRTANWVGWQIVETYMRRHPETTLQELIAMQDAQAVLEASRYRPR